MKCLVCNNDFSDAVYPLHMERCKPVEDKPENNPPQPLEPESDAQLVDIGEPQIPEAPVENLEEVNLPTPDSEVKAEEIKPNRRGRK